MGPRRCSNNLVLLVSFLLLLLTGKAMAQFGPPPVPYQPPSSYPSGGSDAVPFILGALFSLAILIAIIGCVVLPLLSKAVGVRPNVGVCCGMAIPLAIALLYFIWKPLHLTTVYIWTYAGGLGLLVLFILGAIIAGLCRGAYGLYVKNSSVDESSQHFFMCVVIGIGTLVLRLTTKWGFWLSLGGVSASC